jgi:hypothetical protein
MWRELDDRRTAGCCSSAASHSLHGMYTRAPIDRPISAVGAWSGARYRTIACRALTGQLIQCERSCCKRTTYVRTYLLLIDAHVRARACLHSSFQHTHWLELERTKSPFPRGASFCTLLSQAFSGVMDKRNRYAPVRTSVHVHGGRVRAYYGRKAYV